MAKVNEGGGLPVTLPPESDFSSGFAGQVGDFVRPSIEKESPYSKVVRVPIVSPFVPRALKLVCGTVTVTKICEKGEPLENPVAYSLWYDQYPGFFVNGRIPHPIKDLKTGVVAHILEVKEGEHYLVFTKNGSLYDIVYTL